MKQSSEPEKILGKMTQRLKKDLPAKYIVVKEPLTKARIDEVAGKTVSDEELSTALHGRFFEVIGCTPEVGGERYEVYCFEDAQETDEPNYFNKELDQVIFGTVVVCDYDGDGGSLPVTKKEAEKIAAFLDAHQAHIAQSTTLGALINERFS